MLDIAGLKSYLIGASPAKRIVDLFSKRKNNVELPERLSVQYALTDISAMEVQFLYKGIPCSLFTDKVKVRNLAIPKVLIEHYKDRFIYSDSESIIKCPPMNKEYYSYFFHTQVNLISRCLLMKELLGYANIQRKSELL